MTISIKMNLMIKNLLEIMHKHSIQFMVLFQLLDIQANYAHAQW